MTTTIQMSTDDLITTLTDTLRALRDAAKSIDDANVPIDSALWSRLYNECNNATSALALADTTEHAAGSMKSQVEALERKLITAALQESGGVVSKAAKALGFAHHQSLLALLNGRHKDLRQKPKRHRSIIKKGE